MPVYHSVVVEADGKDDGSEKAKTIYVIPKQKTKSNCPGRFGTFPKVLIALVFVMLLIYLLASLGQLLYETYVPKPDKSLETYENTKQFQGDARSNISRLLSSKYTAQLVAVFLLAVLAKYVWGEDE